MNNRLCHKIANRMNVLLQREIAHGIEPARMLSDGLYARDVLLVCDAFRDHELNTLSARFRRAAMAAAESPVAAGRTGAGFSASRFLNSLFGANSTLDAPPPAAQRAPARSWFGRSRGASK